MNLFILFNVRFIAELLNKNKIKINKIFLVLLHHIKFIVILSIR